jgi:hypothetical protein
MSSATLSAPVFAEEDRLLGVSVLAHLDAQIVSARSLLGVVLEQGVAIRAREVNKVVRLAGMLRGEMERRQILERERSQLLDRSAQRLGIPVAGVTLTLLCTLMDHDSAQRAVSLSAQLRGLLHELQREHVANRALMGVELSFLDHLMRTLALDGVHGYDPRGASTSGPRPRVQGALHVLDLRA